MTYFLDFDRTLFDYETYRGYLIELPEIARFKDRILLLSGKDDALSTKKRRELWEEIDQWYAEGGYTLKPGELSRFMFPDALDFLRVHGASSIIVTSGGASIKFQKDKITSAGAAGEVAEVCYLSGRSLSKGPKILSLCERYEPPFFFIDDLVEQLDQVAAAVSGVSLFEIRRDGKEGSGRYPVIHSLDELPV